MFAPITRSMTLTLGLCGAAFSADLLAETEAEKPPQPGNPALELAARKAWAPLPRTLSLTPPVR